MREMTSPEGGFYSAQDADSEGVEGKYYTFTPEEVIKVLGKEAGEEFNAYYQIDEGGNFEGKSIANLIGKGALRIGDSKLKNWQDTLYKYRLNRTELKKDDKILTSWNALMIVAFAKAYAVLQKDEYLECAKRAYEFIQNNLRGKEGCLLIRYREGEAIGLANIDDFSFLLWAQISLYEATYDLDYLKSAKQTANEMIHLFWDEEAGGFFYYGSDAKQLIARPKEVYDGAVPSGNSVAAYALIQLMRILESEELRTIVEKQIAFIAGTVKEHPAAYSFALCAVMLEIFPGEQLICVTWDEQARNEIIKATQAKYRPDLIVLLKSMENEEELEAMVDYTKEYRMVGGQDTFYLCKNRSCLSPVQGIENLSAVL